MMRLPPDIKAPASAMFAIGAFCLLGLPAARADDATPPATLATEIQQARGEMDLTIAKMQTTSRTVRDMLRDARRRGTSRQVACLDEALSRVDVAHRAAREKVDEVNAAYQRSDAPNARLARVRIVELALVQKVAARDGTACIPQPKEREQQAKIAEGTVVRLTIDPKIPRDQSR
jgi:hypothetical protein